MTDWQGCIRLPPSLHPYWFCRIWGYISISVCVGSVACRIPQMQRGGKGSGPTSPEVQEGGWITLWLMAEGRRPNDTPVSRWILTGISADSAQTGRMFAWVWFPGTEEKNCFWPWVWKKNALMNQPLKVSTLKRSCIQVVRYMILESQKTSPDSSYRCCPEQIHN